MFFSWFKEDSNVDKDKYKKLTVRYLLDNDIKISSLTNDELFYMLANTNPVSQGYIYLSQEYSNRLESIG